MPIKLKGRIPADDAAHQVLRQAVPEQEPGCVYVPGVGCIPQYAPTVHGKGARYDPARDCNGFFTSSKYQAHNNCYNYAVDIATNTIAQPGRLNGRLIEGAINGEQVVQFAKLDGLLFAGGPGTTIEDLLARSLPEEQGHFVALLIAPADPTVSFDGDYHWVRCDDLAGRRWSQKDGRDQITNFDFAGELIADPLKANWSENCAPLNGSRLGAPDFFIKYAFQAFLLVPRGRVEII